MRTNFFSSSRTTTPPGMHGQFNPVPSKPILIKREDFEHQLALVHPNNQEHVRSLFPLDSTGRYRTIDQNGLNTFKGMLSKTERDTFKQAMEEYKPSIEFPKPNPNGRMSDAKTANLKDTGRFSHVPLKSALRPAKGEDLQSPIGGHAGGPKIGPRDEDLYQPLGPRGSHQFGMPEDLYAPPFKHSQGKTSTELEKYPPGSLGNLIAKEKANESSHLPPKRVRFDQQPHVYHFEPEPPPPASMSKTKKAFLVGGAAVAGLTVLSAVTSSGVFSNPANNNSPLGGTPASI